MLQIERLVYLRDIAMKNGGIIATGDYSNVPGFVNYIYEMLWCDWNTVVDGSNIAVLKLQSK